MSKPRPCPTPGCPHLIDRDGDCPNGHRATARATARTRADAQRPGPRARGYDHAHQRFRRAVLRRDPTCVLCGQPATDADHWPRTRTQLIAAGDNPNDPTFGRGLCHSCHSRETNRHDGGYGNPTGVGYPH